MAEKFQHFLEDLKKSLEGDPYGYTRQAGKRFCDHQSSRERASYLQSGRQERVEPAQRRDYRNGFYERDYVTRVRTIRLLITRAREPNFAPTGLEKSERRRAGRKSARCRWPTGTSGWQPAIAGLLAELRGESGRREGLFEDLYRRGLEGKHLALIMTDACPGLAAAI